MGEDGERAQIQADIQLLDQVEEAAPVLSDIVPRPGGAIVGVEGRAIGVAGQQDAGFLIGLADRRDPQGPLVRQSLAPGQRAEFPVRIVVAGVGLAAWKHQGAGGEVDLVMALDHQHFEGGRVSHQQDGGRGQDRNRGFIVGHDRSLGAWRRAIKRSPRSDQAVRPAAAGAASSMDSRSILSSR